MFFKDCYPLAMVNFILNMFIFTLTIQLAFELLPS